MEQSTIDHLGHIGDGSHQNVLWEKREMLCAEIVLGVLNDCRDFDPLKAMAWTTINNAPEG